MIRVFQGALDPVMGELPGGTPPSLLQMILALDGYHFDASAAGVLVQNTAPTFVDLNMEAATAVAYTASGSVLSKETAAPHSGLRNLRVTKTGGGGTWANAQQAWCVLQGNRFLYTGWGRGDGTNEPVLATAYNTVSGVAANVWQQMSLESSIAAGGDTNLYWRSTLAGPIGAYAEFDDFTATNLSLNRWNASVLGPSWAGWYLNQATDDRMPWKSTTLVNGLQPIQLATGDMWSNPWLAASFTRFHSSHATLWSVVRFTALPAVTYPLFTTFNGGAANCGVWVGSLPTGAVETYLGNGSGVFMAAMNTPAGTLGITQPHVVVARHVAGTSWDIWVDGRKWSSALVGVESAAAPMHTLVTFGYTPFGTSSFALAHGAVLAPLSDSQVYFLGTTLAAQWGATWT